MRKEIRNPKSEIRVRKISLGAILLGIALLGFIVLAASGRRHEEFVTPLYAAEVEPDTNRAVTDTSEIRAWLHVEVETSYGWFWQKSIGRAFTTADKNNYRRVKVGKLCVQLIAHDTTARCALNADTFAVVEKKSGIFISKKTAIVTAWTENPHLGPTTASLNP